MKRILPLIVLIVAVIFVLLPLFRPGFFVSDDGGWMIIRLSAFYQSFREGQFPVRFLGRLNFGYGYPIANFLYPGFMYIGSFIHFLGISFVNTVKVILGGSILTGSVFTFLWLKKYFKSIAGVIGALGFTFAPYVLFDMYRRGSVGEILALACMAMGLYSIAAKKRWLFGLTVPLLILSHNTLALLGLGFYVFYISILGLWRDFGVMFGVGIGMGAFFWLPALYERKYVIFDSVMVANPREYFITAGSAALLGAAGILAWVAALFRKKLFQKEKLFFLIVAALTMFLVLPISAFLWQIPQVSRIIQFPYRLLSITVFAGAWLMAYVVESTKKSAQLIFIFLFAGLGIWSAIRATSSVDYTHQPEGFYTTNEATTTVADEYMPRWVRVKPIAHAADRLLFYKGRGSLQVIRVTSQTIDVIVKAAEDSVIQINTLYYPGWGATVDDTIVRIDYSNNEDVMRIPVPAGNHHVVLAFRETISRFLADCLSLVSLAGYAALVVFMRNQKSKKK